MWLFPYFVKSIMTESRLRLNRIERKPRPKAKADEISDLMTQFN